VRYVLLPAIWDALATDFRHCVSVDEVEEREIRQLRLMLDRLGRFRRRELPIGPVIDDLSGLLLNLELADDEWQHKFFDAWAGLEIPYAVALDRLLPVPTIEDDGVAEAVGELEEMVRSRLAVLTERP
jgi:hypothetical protein